MEQKHITSPNSTLIKDRVNFQPWWKFVSLTWFKCTLKKRHTKKKSVLIERIMPTQAHADDIKKLPDIYIYIYRELDNVHSRMSWLSHGCWYLQKKTFPLYSKNRYRKFEDLRIFFEELNSNIKDVEEMRKKRNKFTASENCQLQITRHLNKIVFSPPFCR